jgi:hypothetical protein
MMKAVPQEVVMVMSSQENEHALSTQEKIGHAPPPVPFPRAVGVEGNRPLDVSVQLDPALKCFVNVLPREQYALRLDLD